MKITVRTIVRLGAHLPPGRQGNRVELDVAADATPADILQRLGFSRDRNYLVKVNGEIVPQPRHGLARLRDNDELTILPKPKYG
jgi:sulfur carrier protein ThiS